MEAVIFGAGKLCSGLKRGLEKYFDVHICAVCDNDEKKWGKRIENVLIVSPQELMKISFERIFICVQRQAWYKIIEEQLLKMGIPKEKIVNMPTSREYQDAFIERDPLRKIWIKNFADYTKEIGLAGSTAECGVYNGETAMFINKYWPNSKLHLFDTFDGFSEEDILEDKHSFTAFSNGRFSKNPFKIGNPELLIEIIKERMLYPENIKIHKGYFPKSANGIEDTFCFVNLDMDLYRSQLEGLRFFWDKMEKGGVILLHDYFHPELPGVKKAVDDFEKEIAKQLPKMPIGDYCSIAIIK